MRLPTSILLETPAMKDMETVDIQEFLPKRVKDDMTKKDGTVLRIMRYTPTMVDDQICLNHSLDDLVRWARGINMERAMVESMLNKYWTRNMITKHQAKKKRKPIQWTMK